jgi:hypothetical protein
MITAFALNLSLSRKFLSLGISSILFFEGVRWIVAVSVLYGVSSPGLRNSTYNYGPLNIFCSALILTDSSAIHRRDLVYRIAWLVKIGYLLYITSISVSMLSFNSVPGFDTSWLVVRVILTLLWICVSFEELLWWNDSRLPHLPGLRSDGSSSSGSLEYDSE